MSQHVPLDEFAAGLKIAGAHGAQAARDFAAAQPGPAEKLRVVQVLNVVHRKQGRFPVVEAQQADGRGVNHVGASVHFLPQGSKEPGAYLPVHFLTARVLTARQQSGAAYSLAHAKRGAVEHHDFKVCQSLILRKQLPIPMAQIKLKTVAASGSGEAIEQAQYVGIQTADVGGLGPQTLNSDPHRSVEFSRSRKPGLPGLASKRTAAKSPGCRCARSPENPRR